MWLLCFQIILIELINMSEIYHEMSSPTSFDMISHKVSMFFTFNFYK